VPYDEGDQDENRNYCHRALFVKPALASACGQCEWSVGAGDHGAVDRNLLAGSHDHDLAGADVTDLDRDLGAVAATRAVAGASAVSSHTALRVCWVVNCSA
jgi:hypothetical protein